jgi:hypothetical protein
MEDKYNPQFLLGRVAHYFEVKEGNFVLTKKEILKYRIEIEIKNSEKNYTIAMDQKGSVLLLEGADISGATKNHDELEKNKDNLGAVVLSRVQKTSIGYSDFEDFYDKVITED